MNNAWLLAARPKTLPAALVPVWVGSVLAWKLTGAWSPGLTACALLSALAIQIATNLFNDALDFKKGADTEKRLGPVRVTASGLIAPRTVVITGVIMLLVASALALPVIQARGWPILAIGVPSLYFAWGYTGGPVPLAYRGLGELFVLLFFGLVAVAGTVFVNTGRWFWPESLLLGAQVGCLSTALIAINNLRDVAEDARTGKRTLAVRFGVGWAKREVMWLCYLPWLAGTLVWARMGSNVAYWTAPGFFFALLAIASPVLRTPPSPKYNRFLALAGAQLILFAVLFTLGALADRWR
jgi:1,4-dihydroxy-2-naphthoate octaprenyltransferase